MPKTKKKIGLVDFGSNGPETNMIIARFAEEAEKLGYETEMFSHKLFFVSFDEKNTKVFYNEKKINPKDYLVFIPSVNIFLNLPENTLFLNCLKRLGVPVINSPKAIDTAKNKTLSLFKLARTGIPITPSAVNYSEYRLQPLFDFTKNDNFICKVNKSSLGKGVALIRTKISMISALELMAAKGITPSTLIFQKFIEESRGTDTRVIVAGNKVVASMKRKAEGIDFRSNLSGMGHGSKVEKLPDNVKKLAIKAVKALDLDYGGADILMSKKGPMIVEVNANPGNLIEEITGINIMGEVLKHIIKVAEKK